MPITEVIPGALWQSDADPDIFEKLAVRKLTPALVVDLQEFPAARLPADGTILYMHWPIDDGPVPDEAMLAVIAQAAASYIEGGGRVVTICAQGRNRSGLLSALIVSRIRGISGAEAVRFVRSRVPEALTNSEFVPLALRSLTCGERLNRRESILTHETRALWFGGWIDA